MTERHNTDDGIDRRTYLKLASGAAALATAGCAGLGGDGGETERRFGYGGAPLFVLAGSAAMAASTEVEPNDACATAEPLAADETVTGSLERAGVDWYGVDLGAGESFDVVFDRTTASGVTNVVVYGPDCTFLTLRQVGTDREVTLGVTADAAGTYYVELADVESGDGDYALRVDTGTSTATSTPTATDTATSTPTATDTATSTPTATPTATQTATTVADDYGEQAYGEYGYGGVP